MKKTIIFFFFFVISGYIYSQTYLISAQGTVNACMGDFFDSGGASGNYGNNENFVMTFNSSDVTNTHIKMTFNNFDVEPGDTLIVYDGSNASQPVLGKYNNNNMPPSFVDASIGNVSGDLTFRFKSNAANVSTGWFCSVICIIPCQEVNALLHPTLTIPHPNDSNYVDICIGNTITFAARGSGAAFPENGLSYTQDSTNCTYLWDFGDGQTATGQIVNHTYTQVRGYDVSLTVTDNHNCTNANALGARVRVSQSPFAEIHPLPDMCSSSDTSFITLGYNAQSVVVIAPIVSTQLASQRYDSVTFIPDGGSCTPSCYNTYVTFNSFIPGQTITSGSDILSVCMNIEHSFAGDLGFRIICPNGTSVVLDANDHSGSAFLGNAYEPDGSLCDPATNIAGTPWVYGWSQVYSQQGTLNNLDAGTSPIPACDTIAHTGYFTPDNPFSGLIGCPLNGTWNLEICDNWGQDNGYIFWWSLSLDPSLLPTGWSYQVPIDTVIWDGSFFDIINDSTIMVIPDSGGTFEYNVEVIDIFGCSYDTTLQLQVVQTPEVDLGSDTTLCNNNLNYVLDAGPASEYTWSTGGNIQTQPVTSTGIYFVTAENHNISNTLTCLDQDSVFIRVLAQPASADLGPDTCSTVPFPLDAENGGSVFQYNWSTGDTSQVITVSTSGTYSVTVAEEYGYNCEIIDSRVVTIIPEPEPTIGPDSTICSFNYFRMKVKDPDPANPLDNYPYSYLWTTDPVSNLNGQTARDVEFGCLTPGVTYNVQVAVTGCNTVTATRNIISQNCTLELYNIITPNGDGQNDKFKVKGLENFPGSNMKIYNRWGKKVFESNNYGEDDNTLWDGGKDADGVYYYVLTVNYGDSEGCVEEQNYNGTVTIIR
ncbi:MAG TPA: gliding motility-associated C-terminal domain-containing protein [Bacteroidales bacterium]|nr:gliding motility-associated C-terminal domain-containing protein [Bacteroidales bacterium]